METETNCKPSSSADRVYQGGRSTAGWRRGKKIERFAELKAGMILVWVSHAFRGENLVKVVPLPEGFIAVPHEPPAYVRYVRPNGQLTGEPEIMCVHQFEINEPSGMDEFFVAESDRRS